MRFKKDMNRCKFATRFYDRNAYYHIFWLAPQTMSKHKHTNSAHRDQNINSNRGNDDFIKTIVPPDAVITLLRPSKQLKTGGAIKAVAPHWIFLNALCVINTRTNLKSNLISENSTSISSRMCTTRLLSQRLVTLERYPRHSLRILRIRKIRFSIMRAHMRV